MSKIAEKKAKDIAKKLESSQAYKFDNFSVVCGVIEGYDQAMQDFLEKACEWLEDTELENFICRDDGIYFDNEKLIEQFKNYMEEEL